MTTAGRWPGWIALLAFVLPGVAAEPAKDKQDPKKPQHYSLAKFKLKLYDPKEKTLTVEGVVLDEAKVAANNLWYQQKLQEIRQDPSIRETVAKEWEKRRQEVYKPQDFALKVADDVRFRRLYFDVEYDDKGYLKKYTPEELAALKGPDKLPGYATDAGAFEPGDPIEVYVDQKPKQSKPATGKGNPPPPPPNVEEEMAKYTVTMIVLIRPPKKSD